jgi:hypothetical protein
VNVNNISIGSNGELLKNTQRIAPIYRLTEAGWSFIHRSQAWVISTFIVATASLIATIISVYLTLSVGQ